MSDETLPFSPDGEWTPRQLRHVLPILNAAVWPAERFRGIDVSTHNTTSRWYILVRVCCAHDAPDCPMCRTIIPKGAN